ncbi:MAG: SPOR domain-containing protein [Magnetococcales bacterium]|nr:SPOR domain-containing protein [Magnetococcales bacterium]
MGLLTTPLVAETEGLLKRYSAQAASCRTDACTDTVVKKLEESGRKPYILRMWDLNQAMWKTVHVGHYETRDEAQAEVTAIKESLSIDGFVSAVDMTPIKKCDEHKDQEKNHTKQ